MQRSGNSLHFRADAAARDIGSVSAVDVPRYTLYGDDERDFEWMVHLEPLDRRCRERGWFVAPHTHPRFTQLVAIAEGQGRLTIEGDVVDFSAPCVLLIPPFRIHGFQYSENSDGWVLTIETPYLNDLLMRAPELRRLFGRSRHLPLGGQTFASIADNLARLDGELTGHAIARTIGAEIMVLGLGLTLLRALPAEETGRPEADKAANPVSRLRDFIEEHYRRQPSVTAMADAARVTVAKLRHACKEETGLQPLEMLHERLIFEAKRLLVYTTKPISEIGYDLGFEDPAYFHRFFHRLVHVSPSEFRKSRQFAGAIARPPRIEDAEVPPTSA